VTNPKRTSILRILSMMVLATVIFLSLISRLYYLQVIKAQDLREQSKRARTYIKYVPASRGWILDRHQKPLAVNSRSKKFTVTADRIRMRNIPNSEEKDIVGTVQEVGRILNLSPAEIQRHLDAFQQRNVIGRDLARGISEAEKERIEAAGIQGVKVTPEPSRFYPEGTLAAHILGYCGSDNEGLAGLEYALNDKLKGEQIIIEAEKDIHRRMIANRDITKNYKRGADVVLTIDSYIQYVLERELKNTYEKTEALQVNGVIIHPKSGDILAMANYPAFDPNHYQDYPKEVLVNSLLTNAYEPGSVIKPFTVIAALDTGVVTPETVIFCENGGYYFGNHTIRDDTHSFGNLSVHDILVFSSNIGTVKIAQKLGDGWREQASVLIDYYKRFGFKHYGDPPTSDIPGESVGILKPVHQWHPANMGAVPFGQGMMTNTLALTGAYAAIANRGLYQSPHIIKGFRTSDGYFYPREKPEPTRIVAHSVVEEVVEMMVDVTEHEEGTGRRIRIPGYHIAGKTGTAQKVDPKIGTYGRGKRIASFAGFFPAEDPEAVIVIAVDEPKKGKYGGEVTANAWKVITQELIAYWGLTPTVKDDPDLIAETEAISKTRKKQEEEQIFIPKTFGVNEVRPLPAQATVADVTESMPNLKGLPMRDAYLQLTMNGLRADFTGTGKVVWQSVAAGTIIDGSDFVGEIRCEPMLTDATVLPPTPPQIVKARP
jgi:cell division protein FtsI (penicillin-binding protein 3)